jgi:hypothetical protein
MDDNYISNPKSHVNPALSPPFLTAHGQSALCEEGRDKGLQLEKGDNPLPARRELRRQILFFVI